MLRIEVKPLLCGTDDEAAARYLGFCEEGAALARREGRRITEVVDLQGVRLDEILPRVPLLRRLLRQGLEYTHSEQTRICNAPYGIAGVWEAVCVALPRLRDENVVFV